jgi:hypothetical protein
MKQIILALFLVCGVFFASVSKSYADDPCAPTTAPLLYQINRTPTQATLFFTPINNDQVEKYTIVYGLNPEDERYSLTIDQGPTTGAISYPVNDLEPGVQYFYKVRGNTTCLQSPWSSWEGDKAVKSGSSTAIPGIPVTGPETLVLWGLISLLTMVSGFGIFTFSKRKAKYF